MLLGQNKFFINSNTGISIQNGLHKNLEISEEKYVPPFIS